MSVLTNEQKQFLLNLKREDVTAEFIATYLSDRMEIDKVTRKAKNIPSKYKTYDTFTLEKGEYFNTEKVLTNVGLFLFNKILIEEKFKDVVGYVNTPVTKSVQGEIEDKLSKALLNDKITTADMVDYINRTQWLGMQFNSIFSGSFTMNTLKPLPSVIKRRDKLLKDNEETLKNGDIITAVKIEEEIKKMARDELKGDSGMDLYNSGAKGSFDNNYKSISLMKGPVFNPTTAKWEIVASNFMEGIKKEEIPSYGNAMVSGQYPKSVGTQVAGYFSKQLTAAFQGIVLDKPGSDCGTKGTLDILVTPWLEKDLLYRYIIDNNKPVLLTEDNIKKYLNKKVKLRSPMYCIGEKLCRTCAGTMYEKLGIDNVGLTTTKVSSTMLNLNMKKFHDTSASISKIDIHKLAL